MNYTQNYHLPQWVKEDRIMMEDFNAMNSSIESGLTTAVGKADTAISTANAANQAAGTNYGPDNKPYAVGSYTGTGTTPQDIEVGFMPSFVIVCTHFITNDPSFAGGRITAAGPGSQLTKISFLENGFQVVETNYELPAVNTAGRRFEYIAFR